MNSKVRWRSFLLPLAIIGSFFFLAGLALGQGPVLTSLPTPTPMPFVPGTASSSDLIPQAALPDLAVKKIETYPTTPLVGRPSVISVTIKNQGNGPVPAGNNFLTDLYIDPPFYPQVGYHQIVSPTLGLPWGAQWFWVPAGGSYVFTTTWVFTDVKTFDIWAQVDSDGNVTETFEENNVKKTSISVSSANYFRHDSHQDFLTNMASTLDNSDPNGELQLGLFTEPPFADRPFTNGSCQITSSSVAVSDYNMEAPDIRINDVMTGRQVRPQLIANGDGGIVAVWEDGRNGETYNRDVYLRYSTDEGQTWGPEIRVNDDPPDNHVNQLNPVAALSEDGNLLVAWQDRRNGNYDIYAQRFLISGGTLVSSGGNILVGGAGSYSPEDQINPDIAVDEAGGFHVAWQDHRNGNYDIFATSYITITGSYTWTLVRRVDDGPNMTQQVNPTVEVLDWRRVTGIVYTVAPDPPYMVTVTSVLSEPSRILVVTWEDDRNGDADIAMAVSADGGETFDFDQFLTNSSADGDQMNPDVTLTKDTTTLNFRVPTPIGAVTVGVEVPVSGIHTVWEGYTTPENLDRDIYYSQSQLSASQVGGTNAFDVDLVLGGNQKVNQNDARAWQTAPVDQRDPALVAVPCDTGGAAEEGWNLFIAWADGRNYDSANYDIYFTVKSTCGALPAGLATNLMVNDGVRLHNFDASDPSYDDYGPDHPPPGYQVYPSVAADLRTNWPTVLGGYLYLAWEDDRAGNPQAEKDIYFARSNLTLFNHASSGYGAGSQISNILDSGDENTTWYTVDWSAGTAASTYVTVQTRLGNTITDVLNSAWYPQRFPYQPQPGDCGADVSGAPLPGYDAPGQHIEDAAGGFWPKARYIQYRVNFYTRDSGNTPILDNLTLYYDRESTNTFPKLYNIYLPIILR